MEEKNSIMHLANSFCIVIFLLSIVSCKAQPVTVTRDNVTDIWNDHKSDDFCRIGDVKIEVESTTPDDILCVYYLMEAYGLYCKGECDEAMQVVISKSRKIENRLNVRQKKRLAKLGYDEFRDKLPVLAIDCQNLADLEEIDSLRSEDARVVGDTVKRIVDSIIPNIEKSIARAIPYCSDTDVSYDVLGPGRIKFTIETTYCDVATVDSERYQVSQVGTRYFFQQVLNLFKVSVLDDYCAENVDCKELVSVQITGHADGYPVNADLKYDDNSFVIPSGFMYKCGPNLYSMRERRVDTVINSFARSNEELGLVRAFIPYQVFSSITDKFIQVNSVTHSQIGKEYRKVVVTIIADELYSKEFKGTEKMKLDKIERRKNLRGLYAYP